LCKNLGFSQLILKVSSCKLLSIFNHWKFSWDYQKSQWS
jgi:hypothetical protein